MQYANDPSKENDKFSDSTSIIESEGCVGGGGKFAQFGGESQDRGHVLMIPHVSASCNCKWYLTCL